MSPEIADLQIVLRRRLVVFLLVDVERHEPHAPVPFDEHAHLLGGHPDPLVPGGLGRALDDPDHRAVGQACSSAWPRRSHRASRTHWTHRSWSAGRTLRSGGSTSASEALRTCRASRTCDSRSTLITCRTL